MTERPKMSREERAKQFMPFAALKGYEEALREKEREVAEREKKEQLSDEEVSYCFGDFFNVKSP
jgi:hypothetical protein